MKRRTRRMLRAELSDEDAILACAREFHMVGDPTRLKICYLLCRHGELSVGEIAEVVGVSVSAVSHTLRKLRETGMVECRRSSRIVYYQLRRSPLTEYLRRHVASI